MLVVLSAQNIRYIYFYDLKIILLQQKYSKFKFNTQPQSYLETPLNFGYRLQVFKPAFLSLR